MPKPAASDPFDPNYTFGRDPVMRKLRREMRSSVEPVSEFAAFTSAADAARMLDRIEALSAFGVTRTQLKRVRNLVERMLAADRSRLTAERQVVLSYRVGDQRRQGLFRIKRDPDRVFAVQLELPGIVAATAPGFLAKGSEDGFVTEFLPPGFYSTLP